MPELREEVVDAALSNDRSRISPRPCARNWVYTNRCSRMPSTSIRKTEYDPDKRVLSVWFVASGKRYEFEGVPPETCAEFRSAFAKGRYFNEHIRNRFRYRLADNNSG
ncbi:KTSC domain-containing protein [Mesorhizobium sp. dw_380]|uniref:KTSC domain-containing protein n=1 Tax=Mesorhizobium sp. dw_380 TaxID=2812001 RepID=UPI00331A3323